MFTLSLSLSLTPRLRVWNWKGKGELIGREYGRLLRFISISVPTESLDDGVKTTFLKKKRNRHEAPVWESFLHTSFNIHPAPIHWDDYFSQGNYHFHPLVSSHSYTNSCS